jgi:hypothetical protein
MINLSRPLRSLNQVGFAGGWHIWWERKKYVHRETVQNPTPSMSIATLTINYQRAKKKKTRKQEG